MMSSRPALATVLCVLLAGTLAAIGFETDWGRSLMGGRSAGSNAKTPSLETKVLPRFALAPLSPTGSGYRETVERPLFIPTRRPAPAGNSAQMAMKKGQFRLAGTTVSEQVSVAYLFETGTNKTHRVNKGADINGMTVESVFANRVVLKQGDETEELSLRTASSPRLPPPPQQVAGASLAPGQQPGAPVPQAMAGAAPPQPPAAPPPGFAPPGGTFQAGMGQAAPPGMGQAVAPSGARPPGAPAAAQDADPAAAPAAADPNQAQQRRRRFQNLPQ